MCLGGERNPLTGINKHVDQTHWQKATDSMTFVLSQQVALRYSMTYVSGVVSGQMYRTTTTAVRRY